MRTFTARLLALCAAGTIGLSALPAFAAAAVTDTVFWKTAYRLGGGQLFVAATVQCAFGQKAALFVDVDQVQGSQVNHGQSYVLGHGYPPIWPCWGFKQIRAAVVTGGAWKHGAATATAHLVTFDAAGNQLAIGEFGPQPIAIP